MNILNIKTDFNIFKDETLKTLRDIERQINEKMKLKNIETENKIANFDLKLAKFQEFNKRMYDSYVEQHVFLEKLKYLNDFKSNTETRLISFDVKLSNFLAEFAYIKSRYDKLILEHLTVPGIIGTSCKFASISDYINYSINTSDEFKLDKEFMKKQIKELKSKNEIIEKNLTISVENSISICKLYTDTKFNEIKDFYIQKFNEINELLEYNKTKIENNILKNDRITDTLKNEIDITKEEIRNLIEEKKRENERFNEETIITENKGIKKELNEIKKKFAELKTNIEKQIISVYKIGKKKNNLTIYNNEKFNDRYSENNTNILLNTNNFFNDLKVKKSVEETEHITINANSKDNDNNYINDNNNDNDKNVNLESTSNEYYGKSIKYNQTTSNLFKSQKENNNNKLNNHKFRANNKNNTNEINILRKSSKQLKLREVKNIKNSKGNNDDIKDDINPLLTIDNQLENKIIIPESLSINRSDSIKKYMLNNNDKISINNICSNNNLTNKDNYEESNNINNNTTNNTNNNINNINNTINMSNTKERTLINNIYKKEKEKLSKRKYVIHSIDGEKTLSNLKRNISRFKNFANTIDNNNNNKIDNMDKKNIPIKLIKNRMQKINDLKLNYIKQRSPTMKLYKEFYDKKVKKKNEKEKEDEQNKEKKRSKSDRNLSNIKLNDVNLVPKRASPAFGRTAYIEFIKESDQINLKEYNANMNINIETDLNEYINEIKYVHTINGNIDSLLILKNSDRLKDNSKKSLANLSV